MKLMKTKTQSLSKISRELQVAKMDIRNSVQTFRKEKTNLEDPGGFLNPKEKKKWEKLSPRKKAIYHKKAKKRMKYPCNFSSAQDSGWNAVDKIDVEEKEDKRLKTEKQSKTTRQWQTEKSGQQGKSSHKETLSSTRNTKEQGEKAQTATEHLGGITDKAPAAVRAATKAAKRIAEFFQENLQRDEMTHEQLMENAKNAYAQKDPGDQEVDKKGYLAAFLFFQHLGSIVVHFLLVGIPFLILTLIALSIFCYIIIAMISLIGIFGSSGVGSLSAREDPACYLSAKYESHGEPGAIGGIGGLAYGEYQFHATAGSGLNDFVDWCYETRPDEYEEFAPYAGLPVGGLAKDHEFKTIWKEYANEKKARFEADQTIFTYEHYFVEAAQGLSDHYEYDFVNAPDAVKACIVSFSIRDGGYGSAAPLLRYFQGVTASSTPEEVIKIAYDNMLDRRGGFHQEAPRWRDEKKDCLKLLSGELDIYEPDTSPSGYGKINWSWKRPSGIGNEKIAELALSKAGCRYSQDDRDGEGVYDCSSLVYRLYAEVGIHYLSGMSAAEEARYLESNGMGVTEAELQPGDLIFYSHEQNGRYKNINHVAIYIGDGKKVHAKGKKYGVVCDAYRPSNIGVYARPQ